MEILFELKKIMYLLKINEGDIYKPDMKNKDYFDIFDTICENYNYIEKLTNNSYYQDDIKIKSFKYEYTETHYLINNKIYEYKQNHIDKQYELIKEALTKIIKLTNTYQDFNKDDITGEKFYKDYQYQYKIKEGKNNTIEIHYCLGELENDDMETIRGICENEKNMIINKPKITKKFLDSITSIIFKSINYQ